jgi:hypothetical protein
MYTLNFETIKQMMLAYQQTGFLYAEAPTGVGPLREPCRIEIKVMSGTMVSCTVVGTNGRRLTGKEATQGLARLGRLTWTFTPLQEAVVQPTSPVPVVEQKPLLPRRTVFLEATQMRNFSRLQRAILALADGTRTTVKIAEVLSAPPQVVEKALRDLQTMGVITFEK